MPPAARLASLLHPATIAVIGARDDTTTFGGRAWTYLTRSYQGTAIAVNARTDAVRSGPCVAALQDADTVPEAIVVATPAHTVISLLEQAGVMGVRAAVVFSRELLGREDEIRAAAARFGMTVLGPNCLGLINVNAGVILSSSISLERPSRPGPLAFVSQSGALMGLLHARAIDLGLGLGLCASTGSQAMIRAEDILLEVAAAEDIRAAGVYLEDMDVALFAAAAEALAGRGIRLVALKAGSTPAGSRTAAAHSGALASSGQAFSSLARDLGVVVVDDPGELLTTLAVAQSRGPRWHVATSSGGIAAIAADQATAAGLDLPAAENQPAKPAAVAVERNPTDLDAGAATTGQKIEAVAAMARNPLIDGVLVVVSDAPDTGDFMTELSAIAGDGAGRVLVVSECSQQLADIWPAWTCGGGAYLPGLAPVLRAIGRVHGHRPARNAAGPAASTQLVPPGDVQALLREAGIPVLPAVEVDSADAACTAAESLGYPVVLKVSRVLHRGAAGVRLRRTDPRAVAAAYSELAAQGPVLVQQQSPPGLEFYIGARADPVFGSLLLVGAGGPAVEEMADVVIGRPPVNPERIRQLIRSTMAGQWLASPASAGMFDIGSLARTAQAALGIVAGTPDLASLDLNPVVVHSAGVTVVDAKASGRITEPGRTPAGADRGSAR